METHAPNLRDPVRGLTRMVQVNESTTLFDLTIKGLHPGKYWASIREYGDIADGAASVGGIWDNCAETRQTGDPRLGILGQIMIGNDGQGSVLLHKSLQIWEIIGRSLMISQALEGPQQTGDVNTLVGVIARSAGVWENEKTVCSCSGKTMWEERKESVVRGLP